MSEEDNERKPKGLDRIDRKILTLLQKDSTIPSPTSRTRWASPRPPAGSACKKLEQMGVITGRVALVSPEKIGLGLTVFVSIETSDHSRGWIDRFAQIVSAMPEVMELYRMAGDVDYMLRVIVTDMAAYDAFYKRLIDAVPLKNVTSRFAMERIKSTTVLAVPPAAE